jgi:hypothetical protein
MEALARKAGLNPHSKMFKQRALWYCSLKVGLIDAEYSPADADKFISHFMTHHITSLHLLDISCAISKARGRWPVVRRDPDLTAVMDAWERLPQEVRTGIVAIVRAVPKVENAK